MSISVGFVSYGLAALAFTVLSLLLVTTIRAARRALWLLAATLVSALWAGTLAYGAMQGRLPLLLVYSLEISRDGLWLTAIVLLGRAAIPRALIVGAVCLASIVVVVGTVLPALRLIGVPIDQPNGLLLSRTGLVFGLLGLVLLEQIFRNTPVILRRQLTYLILGIGGLFAYDLFLYAQAELLRAVDLDAWNARGVVCAVLVPLIALAVRRNPTWSLEIFVSRQVVFYSGAVMAVGAYLLLMSLGGFYVREIGGSWGRVGQLLFFSGAAVVLLTLVFSEAIRRHFKVAIDKHFFKNKYDYRSEWLRFIGTLSSAAEHDVGRRSLQAVAQIFSCPGGVLFLQDDASNKFSAAAAWPMQLDSLAPCQDLDPNDSLPDFLVRRQWVVDLVEYHQHPERYDFIDLPSYLALLPESRIVSPIFELDRLVGFVVLFSPPPPFELTYEDRDLLKTVGRHIATQILQQRMDHKLAESRQFDAYNRLTAFMMHDLKNSLAQLKLLVDNAARHKHKPEFVDDAISTIANTVERITRLIEQLKREANTAGQLSIEVERIVKKAIERCIDREPRPQIEQTASMVVRADAEQLLAMIEHLVRNSQDATPSNGKIWIEMSQAGANAIITISDTGCGMDAQFMRERLFRPFDTTKGSKGMGIGAYQVREYARRLGGDVEVRSSPGRGTHFSIKLPIAAEGASLRLAAGIVE